MYGGAFGYSMYMTNFSLTLISYPTQALAKSCKILPAMIGSLFVKGIKYHPLQYLSVALITAGVIAFNYNNKKGGTSDSLLGMFALSISLGLDAVTSYYVELLQRNYGSTALSIQQICSGFGTLMTLPLVIVRNFMLPEVSVIGYILKFPSVLLDIFVFAFMSAVGNYFIFWGLNLLGSLNLVIITTTRKFLTIFISIVLFSHHITFLQTICISLVVVGAALDIYVGHRGKHKDDKKKE